MDLPGKVAIIGHSYMALENRKQLDALAEHTEVLVLSPRRWHEGMSHFDFPEGTAEGGHWRIRFMQEVRFPVMPQSQYILAELTKTLRTYNPDLIHIESDPWTLFAAQAIVARNRIDRRIPIVCTAKQNTYTTRGAIIDGVKNSIGKWGIRNTARFIAVSALVLLLYAERFKVPPGHFDFNTHLGIDTSLFYPVSDNAEKNSLRRQWIPDLDSSADFFIGYCGRLEEYKGVTDLIEAVRRAQSGRNIDVHLLLLGDGPLKAALEELSLKDPFLHLFSRVPHAEVAGFMKTLDLFVMPARKSNTHEEHDAHAVIEALSCGLPCIGTDSGAIPEVLADAGRIIPSSDIEELGEALLQCIPATINQNTAAPYANIAGRERIKKNYSVDAVAGKNLLTYMRAIEDWRKLQWHSAS